MKMIYSIHTLDFIFLFGNSNCESYRYELLLKNKEVILLLEIIIYY